MQSNSFAIRLLGFLKRKKIAFIYIPMSIYWLLITVGMTIPAEKIIKYSINDKLEHMISQFILAIFVLFFNAFQEKFKIIRKHPFIFVFVFLALYGAVSELIQLFIPDRFCDIYDWLADIIGILTAVILLYPIFGKALKNFNESIKVSDN